MNRSTIIAKTTHGCNQNCKYCMIFEDADKSFMDSITLENTIVKTADFNKEFGSSGFIWHGGEPLLMGLDFYKQVIEIQNKIPNHKFRNSIQTNGILLENYIDFFVKNNFHVGISLDGIEETHNYLRPLKNNQPSFNKTLNAIKLAKKHKIGGGVIMVLNKITAAKINEIYDFFKENEINHQLNPQIPAGQALVNKDLGLDSVTVGNIMKDYFDKWFNDYTEPILHVDPFTHIMYNLGVSQNKKLILNYPISCTHSNNCSSNFFSVGPNGDIYPCGRFNGDKEFYMGNININSLFEANESKVQEIFKQREKGLDECKECDYVRICNSGCPDNAYLFHKKILAKDGLCAAYKILFKHINNILKQELSEFNES